MQSVQSVRLDGWVCAMLADGQLTVSFFFFLEVFIRPRVCLLPGSSLEGRKDRRVSWGGSPGGLWVAPLKWLFLRQPTSGLLNLFGKQMAFT